MLDRRSFLIRAAASTAGIALPVQRPIEDSVPKVVRTRLLFGGDVMLSRHVGRLARAIHDPASPFRDIAPVFREADIAFVNLEAPCSDRGELVEKGLIFKAEPEMIAGLTLAGIDIVSTANNHARDRSGYG